jgi:hypothetical protein
MRMRLALEVGAGRWGKNEWLSERSGGEGAVHEEAYPWRCKRITRAYMTA